MSANYFELLSILSKSILLFRFNYGYIINAIKNNSKTLSNIHQLLQQRYFKLTLPDVKLIRPGVKGERVASSIFYFIIMANYVKTYSTD